MEQGVRLEEDSSKILNPAGLAEEIGVGVAVDGSSASDGLMALFCPDGMARTFLTRRCMSEVPVSVVVEVATFSFLRAKEDAAVGLAEFGSCEPNGCRRDADRGGAPLRVLRVASSSSATNRPSSSKRHVGAECSAAMGRDAGIRLSFKKGWLAIRSSEGLKG